MPNKQLAELALKLGAHMIEKLNEWDDETLQKAIVKYEVSETTLDSGVAQVLRLYKTARTIGKVANRPDLRK